MRCCSHRHKTGFLMTWLECNMMQITRKRIKHIHASYTLEGTVLENVESLKYLGITITNIHPGSANPGIRVYGMGPIYQDQHPAVGISPDVCKVRDRGLQNHQQPPGSSPSQMRPKHNTCVSTNPTDPTFRADPAFFIAILKNIKRFIHIPTLSLYENSWQSLIKMSE